MRAPVFHVFRNSPRGFETFRGALWLGRATGLSVRVYFPEARSFVLYFEGAAVQVDLDESYLYAPDTARRRARAIGRELEASWSEQPATGHTGSTLPDIRGRFSLISCPRAMASPFSHPWLPPAVLGPRVQALVRRADAPVFLPAPCWIPWDEVISLYGGSSFGLGAVLWGRALARLAGVPFRVLTHTEGVDEAAARRNLERADLLGEVEAVWERHSGTFREMLQDIPRTALVVLGAFGASPIRERVVGSRAHTVLMAVPYNLVLVGPQAKPPGALLGR